MPQRPRGGQRHHIRRAPRYARQRTVSGGRDAVTGELVKDTALRHVPEAHHKRGDYKGRIRVTQDEYTVTLVRDWIFNDDTLR